MDSLPVHIAGGGIAGLASALALAPHHRVVVLEQAEAFSEVGAGLQLGPNAMRALQKLGAAEAVEAITMSPPEIHMRDGRSGRLLNRLRLGQAFSQRYGAPYRVALRTELHSALLQVAKAKPGIDIRTAQRINRVDANPLGITLQVNHTELKIQHLIAADGVNSVLRQSLFPGTSAVDSGEIFHRSLVPNRTVTGVDMDCVNLWMMPGGHVVHYPVGHRGLLNLVAITPKGTTPSRHFAKSCAALSDVLSLVTAEKTPWPGLYAPQMQSWSRNGVLLLGDAAHATLPYLAQGAAMSLEDAAMLAQVLPTTHSLDHAFAETAARRKERATRLQQESLKAGRTYHLKGLMRIARNTVLSMMPHTMLQARLDWLYRG